MLISSSQRRQAPRTSGSGSAEGARMRARERSSMRWERLLIWELKSASVEVVGER